MSDSSGFACPECPRHTKTSASYCPACGRVLPLFKLSHMSPAQGLVAERQAASPAHFEPMPQAVVQDLEAIRRKGKPARPAWMLVGESEMILAIPVLGFAFCFCATVIFGIIHNIMAEEKGDYRDVFLAGGAISFAVGIVLYFLAKVLKPLVYVFLNMRAGGDRLLTDRRVLFCVIEEGVIWHDPFGLRYVPWAAVVGLNLESNEEGATLRFSDSRTNEAHQLRSALMFNRMDVKAIHAEMAKRLAAQPA
ncbi:MAG: hypothetical protein HS116_20105 [Planctomycetes bacterium]|nr:hypothetical protein [Planctomycetota bacterium]